MNPVSETYVSNHPQPNHIFPLDFESVQDVVPDSHTWNSPLNMFNIDESSKHVIRSVALPVIDLDDPNALELLGDACQTWGVFQVMNHGVPLNLIKNIESESRRLFSLPTEQKLKAVRLPGEVSGYGLAHISKFFPKKMWSESFCILGSPVEQARKLWPDQDEADYSKFCEVIEEYRNEMKKLSERLMCLMLSSLGINTEDPNWTGSSSTGEQKDTLSLLQLNSYPVCPDPNRAMGLGPHTDSPFFTVVHQTGPGLHVHRNQVGWVEVPPLQNALTIHIGDLFTVLSNGRFMSCVHRAAVNQTRHRLSVVYLHGPPMDVKVSPLMKLVDPDHPPLYRSVTWKEFLDIKAKNFDKALDQLIQTVELGEDGKYIA
ncbi:Oxoglutarate/iron-dependent dioxygenase [Macleaya cordata]|uniref:gibberellin 3beta-dioxygenase n=1 Tax=Macleaya cordata TaxID=56857 RepID=A0A200PN70_MACCD|nr:Oxoglutarate/iron-dependent dioxygenase [Macleaya cordata]